jgi:capsular exopolysaccharide synthesis family protein
MGLLEGRVASLTQEQISELGQQIIMAQTQRANAEARLETVTAALATQDGIYDLPEVQQSQIIRDLRAQESKLVQSMVGMQQDFKSSFPRVAQVRAQLKAIHERIRAEVERIAGSLHDDVQIAQARESFLEAKMAALGRRVYRGKEGEIQLHSLQHEADADRALYDRLLARAKETQVETGLQQPDAQIVSQAEPPERPSFPNPLIILPACFVASCLLTILLVLLMENLDHGISNLDQMEETLGVTGLGLIPSLTRHMRKGLPPEAYALKAPLSVFSEALRGLYTNLLLSGDEKHPKVILFASAAPGEGKTTIVLSLARLMAASGKRVLLLDCDTRRPALHKALGLNRSPGLVDFLRDGGDVSQISLQQDPISPAMLLSAGPEGAVPPGIFASDAMRTLITRLSERFDLILIDSAPVLLVSDTRALGQLADKTVLIVRWQATRREQAAAALRQMVQARSNVAGVLLSMADPRSYVSRGESGLLNRDIRLYLAR